MNKTIQFNNPLLKMINNSLVNLPTPSNISTLWNFGSLLGFCLLIQILTGLFLTMHYSANIMITFDSVIHICRDMNYGWLIRNIHSNGASFTFMCLFIHVGRGIYYNSFKYKQTWVVGVMLLFLMMAAAFMGYVLPWGQMSFWGATVITNLLSAMPYYGVNLVQWIWGGFAVDNATLVRFYSFHFILPFLILMFSMIHLLMLHQLGSNNPIGLNSNIDKSPFHPYFTFKDIVGFFFILLFLFMLTLMNPYMLSDPDNFIPANPLITPVHIQPEWYFLFAYAILRSIPNKLGGVISLIMSISILFIMPFSSMNNKLQNNSFYPINKILFWSLVMMIMFLTWIGMCSVEDPYIYSGQMFTIMYFLYYLLDPLMKKIWDLLTY